MDIGFNSTLNFSFDSLEWMKIGTAGSASRKWQHSENGEFDDQPSICGDEYLRCLHFSRVFCMSFLQPYGQLLHFVRISFLVHKNTYHISAINLTTMSAFLSNCNLTECKVTKLICNCDCNLTFIKHYFKNVGLLITGVTDTNQ